MKQSISDRPISNRPRRVFPAALSGVALVAASLAGCGDADADEERNEGSTQQVDRRDIDRGDAGGRAVEASAKRSKDASNSTTAMSIDGPNGEPLLELSYDGGDQVRVGETNAYDLTVTNVGDEPVHGVRVTTMASGEAIGIANTDEGSGHEMQFGMIDAGASKTKAVELRGRSVGRSKLCLLVDYTPAVCIPIEVSDPELELRAELLKEGPFYRCDDIPVRYTVENVGSGKSDPVSIDAEFAEGMYGPNGDAKWTFEAEGLESGSPVTKDVNLSVDRAGTFDAVAEARLERGSRLSTKPLEIRILDPKLEVSIDAPRREFIGRTTDVIVEVSNPSDDPARDVTVQIQGLDNLSNLTVRGADGSLEDGFTMARLEGGQTRSVRLRGELVEAGEASITATASAYCIEQVEDSASFRIEGLPALQMELVDTADPIKVGEETEYRIRVWNEGTAADANVGISVKLPEGLKMVSLDGEEMTAEAGSTKKIERTVELEPGEAANWTIGVVGQSTGQQAFEVHLRSDQLPRAIKEQEPTRVY